MKARIIDTNEEITLLGISVEYGTAKYLDSNGAFNVRCFRDKEIQILEAEAPINWEQRRYEIAKDVMCAFLRQLKVDRGILQYPFEPEIPILTEKVTLYADALIAKLKGEPNEQNTAKA